MLYICCCFCVDPHQLHIYNDCGFNFIFKRRIIMKKITFWLLVSAAVRCLFGGIAGVLFAVWICNEVQNVGLSIKSAGECIVGAVTTAMLVSRAKIEWLRAHAVAVVWVSGMVFIIDALLVLTGNVWVIITMGIFATTVVAIIHQTTISDMINNIYVGTDRTVLNNKLFVVSAVASAAGSAIAGVLTPDIMTMGVLFVVEAVVSTCITLKVVKLMLSYLK